MLVNDIHSELNETNAREIVPVTTVEEIRTAIAAARSGGVPVAIAGGRHAMGGQQFCADGVLLDTRPLDAVHSFDAERGLIEVGAGLQWPGLTEYLGRHEAEPTWGFRQKQTGADRLSIGGALSANAHGRGLALAPFVSDVESFTLVDAEGELRVCSRSENAELFGLVAGGYGLFGCIASVTVRLARRIVLERVVEVREIHELAASFDRRIDAGFLFGDFQFATDAASDVFLRRGVFSCYRPSNHVGPLPRAQRALSREDWTKLIALAHTDKGRAFDLYAQHYLATSGQLYHSDAHQFADYEDGYHHALDRHLGHDHKSSEMISEIYVPRDRLADLMEDVADDFRRNSVNVIYGTIRLIERDTDSFLPWASDRWACVIFNLHVDHTPAGLEHAAAAFGRLIDHASDRGGSYFLTYHRYATREQVERCYPQFVDFLRHKLLYDPEERFQSDWYRHYRAMFSEELGVT